MVESNVYNQEALIGKVSEQVFERIKPIEQKLQQIDAPSAKQAQPQIQITQPAIHALQNPGNSGSNNSAKLSYLANNAETSIIILNWIEFLLEKVGRNNLAEILEYYVEIGWISEEVCSKLISYANGIDYYVERPTWKLLPDDHTKSLMFIEQLKGRKLDKTMLSKLERDVDKVIRTNEIYIR